MGSETPPGGKYGRIWRGLTRRLDGALQHAREQTAAAPRLLAELLGHPHAERLRILQSRSEFRTAPLCAALLEKSYELLAPEAEEAERLALLAVCLLPELRDPGIGSMLLAELSARAWCLVADARRRLGKLDVAEEAFAEAGEWLSLASSDMEQAGFCALLADLRRAQGRVVEARALSAHASSLFAGVTERREHGEALEEQAHLQLARTHVDEAIVALAHAFALAEPRLDAVNALEARYDLAQCLAAQGKPEQALAALQARRAERRALSPDLRRRIETLAARLHKDASGAEAAGAPGGTLFELLLHTRTRLTVAAGPWGVPDPEP